MLWLKPDFTYDPVSDPGEEENQPCKSHMQSQALATTFCGPQFVSARTRYENMKFTNYGRGKATIYISYL